MYFGSTNNIYSSQLTFNIYSPANVEALKVNADIPRSVHYNQPCSGFNPAEVFSHRSHAAQSMLQGFLTLCTITNNGTKPDQKKNEEIGNAISNGGQYYASQLRNIIAAHPPLNLDTIDDQILERTWCKFYFETCECISIIEKTPELLRSGLGASFLLAEIAGQMRDRLTELKKIDAIITAIKSVGQSTATTQTDAVRTSPSRPYRSSRFSHLLRFPRPPAISTESLAANKVQIVEHTGTQTSSYALSNSETQTPVKQQTTSVMQTEGAAKIAVASCATQSENLKFSEQITQTGVRSSGFSRKIKTQTESTRKELKHKSVETIPIPSLRLTNAKVQTESEEVQFLNKECDSLQVKVEKLVAEISANSCQQLDEKNRKSSETIQYDLNEHFSQVFTLLKAQCDEAKTRSDTTELWRTFAQHYLPCMEQLRSARSQLFSSLFLTQFTKKDQHKKAAIESIIEVLDMAVLLALESNTWIQDFKWGGGKEKKAVLARWQTFIPKVEALQNMLHQQFRLGKYIYGSGQQALPIKLPKDQTDSLDMNEINSALCEVSALVDIENLSIHQNDLINDLANKGVVFKHAEKADIENFLFHTWLPSVAAVKLLAQKRRDSTADGDNISKLEHTMNVFLRDAHWGVKKIIATQFNDQTFANDPAKKRLIEGFKEIAKPESFGLLADETIVQELLAFKFSEMHHAFSAEHKERASLSFLISCLGSDDFTLETVEEWTMLIEKIKTESRKMISAAGNNSNVVTNYMAKLKQAKSLYTAIIRPGISKEDDKKEFAIMSMMVNSKMQESIFGVGIQHKKALTALENLTKSLGL